ncbi:hypothetical protein SCALM49S_01043 [Streptomyces californicus]
MGAEQAVDAVRARRAVLQQSGVGELFPYGFGYGSFVLGSPRRPAVRRPLGEVGERLRQPGVEPVERPVEEAGDGVARESVRASRASGSSPSQSTASASPAPAG